MIRNDGVWYVFLCVWNNYLAIWRPLYAISHCFKVTTNAKNWSWPRWTGASEILWKMVQIFPIWRWGFPYRKNQHIPWKTLQAEKNEDVSTGYGRISYSHNLPFFSAAKLRVHLARYQSVLHALVMKCTRWVFAEKSASLVCRSLRKVPLDGSSHARGTAPLVSIGWNVSGAWHAQVASSIFSRSLISSHFNCIARICFSYVSAYSLVHFYPFGTCGPKHKWGSNGVGVVIN